MGLSINGTPKWMVRSGQSYYKMDDLGVPPFRKPPYENHDHLRPGSGQGRAELDGTLWVPVLRAMEHWDHSLIYTSMYIKHSHIYIYIYIVIQLYRYTHPQNTFTSMYNIHIWSHIYPYAYTYIEIFIVIFHLHAITCICIACICIYLPTYIPTYIHI